VKQSCKLRTNCLTKIKFNNNRLDPSDLDRVFSGLDSNKIRLGHFAGLIATLTPLLALTSMSLDLS